MTQLSARENDVLELLVKGLLQKEIAQQLGISYWTVQTHIARIYRNSTSTRAPRPSPNTTASDGHGAHMAALLEFMWSQSRMLDFAGGEDFPRKSSAAFIEME